MHTIWSEFWNDHEILLCCDELTAYKLLDAKSGEISEKETSKEEDEELRRKR